MRVCEQMNNDRDIVECVCVCVWLDGGRWRRGLAVFPTRRPFFFFKGTPKHGAAAVV